MRWAPALLAYLFAAAGALAQSDDPPWSAMDYGPYKAGSYVIEAGNVANKGIAIRLDSGPGGISKGREFMLFETDTLRWAAGWTGPGFIDWNSITYNGRHVVDPRIVGDLVFTNSDAPGWADRQGSFADTRYLGRGGRRYGPMLASEFEWRGLYLADDAVVLSYRVGDAEILERATSEASDGLQAMVRTLNVGPRAHPLVLQVAEQDDSEVRVLAVDSETTVARFGKRRSAGRDRPAFTAAAVSGAPDGWRWLGDQAGRLRLHLPAGDEPLRLKLFVAAMTRGRPVELQRLVASSPPPDDLTALTGGGKQRWTETVTTRVRTEGDPGDPFLMDVLTTPLDNPYRSWMRLGGFDFFADGKSAAVCTWMGDVWVVDGLGGQGDGGELTWTRIATGLYEALGLKIVDDVIYVTGRDQITRLHDLNGDREVDFYEAFNHDSQSGEHFHEFAVGLETDADGNFYYARCAGHDYEARVPQHGTLIKVGRDGSESEIIAAGFRAPNGLAVNPDGRAFVLTDQEGHWTPKNKINWVEPGQFYGYMKGWHRPDQDPDVFVQPVVWIHNEIDRSPSEPVWVPEGAWGALGGSLIHLSYGTGQIYGVMMEQTESGVRQGAVTRLPIRDTPTGLVRGRFHGSGDLYTVGLFGWASNKTQPGGFYRVRYTGAPIDRPMHMHIASDGIVLRFTDPLDRDSAVDAGNYDVRIWQYRRAESYGSEDYRILGEGQGRDRLEITEAAVSDDGRTVFLRVPQIRPAMQVQVDMNVRAASGQRLRDVYVHGTIHEVGGRGGSQWMASQSDR